MAKKTYVQLEIEVIELKNHLSNARELITTLDKVQVKIASSINKHVKSTTKSSDVIQWITDDANEHIQHLKKASSSNQAYNLDADAISNIVDNFTTAEFNKFFKHKLNK